MKKFLPYILIAVILVLAGGFYLDATQDSQTGQAITDIGKQNEPAPKVTLKNLGPAPEFSGISKWLNLPENRQALSLTALKGNVVLVDFWTYTCINCIRTMPYITKWYDTYKDKGFVIVGVHTPEFEFEKVTENVQTAIKRYGINYPVAQDNDFSTWKAYSNRYWPAHYLIDKEGNIVYTHFGEGNYANTENTIRYLLGLELEKTADISDSRTGVKTPEIYFGSSRLEYITRSQRPSANLMSYSLPKEIESNRFAVEGDWRFEAEKAVLENGPGKIVLKFTAAKVHMVAKAGKATNLKVYIKGEDAKTVEVFASDLYNLFESGEYKERELIIEIPESGFEAFTFTFG